LAISPGVVTGTIEHEARTPPLPYDVPSAGPARSISTTWCPSRCNQIAVDTPTIPAPMIAMVFAVSVMILPNRPWHVPEPIP